MKKLTILLISVISFNHIYAQNAPVIEKAAPQSNNTLPSGGSLGSHSGVNPMGNPGTIANSSATSGAVNSGIAAHPNIEPGVFLTSSPGGTVITTTVVENGTAVQTTAIATTSGTIPVSTTETITTPAPSKKPEAVAVEPVRIAASPVVEPAPVIVRAKELPAYTPVLGNYVSQQTINNIKNKYGKNVYDVRTIRIASTSKIAYVVRLMDNGILRTELYYDEP